jgi:hypothetical protein
MSLGALLVLASACGEGDQDNEDGADVGSGEEAGPGTTTAPDTTEDGADPSGDPGDETTGGDEEPETGGDEEDEDTDDGPPNGEPCDPFDYLSLDDALEAMSDDIDDIEDDDERLTTRYISCAHLANQGICGEELQLYTDAVKKLVNSTSVDPTPFELREVAGTNGTIFAVDIDEIGWNVAVVADVLDTRIPGNVQLVEDVPFEDKWELLVTASSFAWTPDRGNEDADNLVVESNTFEPFIQCDAFLEVASRSDDIDVESAGIYNDLAEIPARLFSIGNNDSLEELLNFDIEDDLVNEDLRRVGVLSPDSVDGELAVDFHDGGNGEFIAIRYDNDLAANLSVNPINFADFNIDVADAFTNVQNAEIIYSLPNNLFAYMAVDLNGLRIDAIDSDVFNDPVLQQDKGGDTLPALSCMGCHDGTPLQGITDEVRDLYVGPGASEPNGDIDEEDVEAIYPEEDELVDDFLEPGNEDVLSELEGILQSTDFDGVQRGYIEFRDRVNGLKAETELWLDEGDLDQALGDLDDQFQVFDDESGEVARNDWEDFFQLSICDTDIADDAFCDDLAGTLNAVLNGVVRPGDEI